MSPLQHLDLLKFTYLLFCESEDSMPRTAKAYRTIAAGFIVIALIGLPACRTMYDPVARDPVNQKLLIAGESTKTYESAIKYARAKQEAYIYAMVRDAVISDRVALGLLPLGAAALGLGISGTSGDPLTALGLAGATGYGLGTWFTSKARREVFGVGAGALGCVVVAAAPLNIDPNKKGAIGEARKRLVEVLPTLRATIDNYDVPNKSAVVADLVMTAKTALADAEATRRHADDVLTGLNQAGSTIVDAVEAVRLEITRAAVGTAQDLRDLQDHLKSSVYGPFQDIIGLATPARKLRETEKALQNKQVLDADATAKADLLSALQAVRVAADALAREVEAVNISGVPAEFGKCLDSARGLRPAAKLRIIPGSLVRVAAGSTARIVITGAKTRPTVVPLWPPAVKIQVTEVPEAGPAFVDIGVDASVPAGTYFLSIRDEESDVEKTVRIEVGGRAQAGPPAAGPSAQEIAGWTSRIKAKLNEKLPAAKWTDAEGEWSTAALPGAAEFRLRFKTDAAAKAAASQEQDKRLAKVPDAQQAPPIVSSDQKDFVLKVPNVTLKNVIEQMTEESWPPEK